MSDTLEDDVMEPAVAGETGQGSTGDGASSHDPVIDVRGLRVGFRSGGQTTSVVEDVGFTLRAGRSLALVGESGSGKSVTARSLIGLAGENAIVQAERLRVRGHDVLDLSARRLRALRGVDVGLVLQDALVSLDPLRTIGAEIGDALRLHTRLNAAQRRSRVLELLTEAGVPEPEQRIRQRSGELSGGLRQRALIASAVALRPPVLIADEPTTALDATVQEQILALLNRLKEEGASVLLISHDLAVVGRVADDIAVMNGGRIVEQGPVAQVLGDPRDEYTKRLIRAIPADRPRGTRLAPEPTVLSPDRLQRAAHSADRIDSAAELSPYVLEGRSLVKEYRNPDGSPRRVLDDVSFALRRGTTLGLVGESGSGKTTTARLALGIERPDAGEVLLDGADWSSLPERARRPHRSRIAAIYQDPLGSFDPRWSTEQLIVEALSEGRTTQPRRHAAAIAELLDAVGLPAAVAHRRPRHLSGGQRQRVAIARALAVLPEVIVCDEPVSALDVSVQAQVLDLLDELQRVLGLSYLFISHDLGVVQHVSDEVAVMSQGRIVESGPADRLFTAPEHPYTRRLLDAAPRLRT